MKSIARILAGTAMVGLLGMVSLPALSQNIVPRPAPDPFPRPAPGPIAGAGLPVLVVGYGVYWLVTRRRRKAE
jgi:hypothetical protein